MADDPAPLVRPWTPDEKLPNGSRRIRTKRACNGCGEPIGDVNAFEIAAALAGQPLPDVRDECKHCRAEPGGR